MEIFAAIIGVFSGLLAWQGWQNGRWMKQAHGDTLALLAKMDERTAKMDERTAKMDERMQRSHEETRALLAKMDEHILEEGHRTRETIRGAR